MIAPSKDLEQEVHDTGKKFPEEVIGIRYSVGNDWSGDPAIFFRILLTEKASRREVIGDIAQRVRRNLSDVVLLNSSDYIPSFSFRSKSEQEKLKDPEWPSPTIC